MKPLQTGFALSATVAVFYSLCTLVEVLWPAQFMGFMNALFPRTGFPAPANSRTASLARLPIRPGRDGPVVLRGWRLLCGRA